MAADKVAEHCAGEKIRGEVAVLGDGSLNVSSPLQPL